MKIDYIGKFSVVRCFRVAVAAIAMPLCLLSCSDDETNNNSDYKDIEQELFDRYMTDRFSTSNPELLSSRQEEGYYFLVDDSASDLSSPATNADTCWVRFNITSRNFTGDNYNEVNLTRNRVIATQQNTFTLYTHYAPYLHFHDVANEKYDSSLSLIMRDLPIREGDKISLYSPSSLSTYIVNGGGGYAGSTSLTSGIPFWSEIEITDVIEDLEEWELNNIDEFVDMQQSTIDWVQVTSEDDEESDDDKESEVTNLDIYMYSDFDPEDTSTHLDYIDTYDYKIKDYGFSELEQMINDSLTVFTAERVEAAIESGANTDNVTGAVVTGPLVEQTNSAKVWYVGRLMDGFIFDSNIEPVRELMFNSYSAQTYVSYTPDADRADYIDGWYHSIPKMDFGTWNVVVISSPYAYGNWGITGNSYSTEIPPFTPLIFYIYIEPYID